MRRHAVYLLLVTFFLQPAAAHATWDRSPGPLFVSVGFGGQYKVGVWTPVEVVSEDFGPGQVTVTVPDGDGIPSRVSAPLRNGQARFCVRFGRVDGDMAVAYTPADGPVVRKVFSPSEGAAEFRPALAADTKLIVTVGADSLGVDEAVGTPHRGEQRRIVIASLDDCSALPDQWYGYEGVDAVMLATGRSDKPLPTEAQAAALERWVTLGGRLVLAVGAQGEAVLAEASPLVRFAPGPFEEMVPLRRTAALESFADGSKSVAAPGGGRPALGVPRLTAVVGVVEAREADLPLVVRTARGFGQIVFLAADLDRGPLAAWPDRPKLVARLLDLPEARPEPSHEGTAVMHLGFHDMAGQLRSALDRFAGVRLAPFSLVVGLIVLYLLAIGPLDYFFLRRFARRMQWTWITFPAVVLVFCAGAYLLADALKGRRVRIHQADLVDVDLASGVVRGTSWANVFSPRTQAYNISLAPSFGEAAAAAEVLVSWFGLPGEALGGMNPRTSNLVDWAEQYAFSPDLSAMIGVPMPTWSTKSLVARWNARGGGPLEARLVEEDTSPSGTITNTADVALSNCVLAYRSWAYDLGTLKPGVTVTIGPLGKRSELKTLLTGRKFILDSKGDQSRQEVTPYDRSSVEAAYVLRTMMFFDAAGGARYTGLGNGYQSFVDLSDLLQAGRAIFIARADAETPTADWLDDGVPMAGKDDTHVTIYRFVLPVERTTKDEHRR